MPAVAAVAKRVLAVATERELPFWEAVGRAFMAWCAVELGKIDEGIVTLVRGFEIFRGANLVYWMPTYLCWLADAYRRSGEATRARECLARAREIMARGGECWYEAESWRIEGVLLAREPNEGQAARRAFERALELTRERGQRSFELRSVLALAELMAGEGQAASAEALLRSAMAPFEGQPASADLGDAKAFLQTLEGGNA